MNSTLAYALSPGDNPGLRDPGLEQHIGARTQMHTHYKQRASCINYAEHRCEPEPVFDPVDDIPNERHRLDMEKKVI